MLDPLHPLQQRAIAAGDPADPEARQSIRFRDDAKRNPAFVCIHRRRESPRWIPFDEPIHLVAEQPDAVVAAKRDQRVESIALQDLASRIVGKVDRDQLRVRPDGRGQALDVECPAASGVERHSGDRAQAERYGLHGLVVRRYDDRMIIAVEQRMHRNMDALLGSSKAEHRIGARTIIAGGDRLPEPVCATRIGIAEPQGLPALPILVIGHSQQVCQRQGLAIGRGQVVTSG